MLTIQNNTDAVVVVYNTHYSYKLAPNDTLQIDGDEPTLHFRYLSFDQTRTETKTGLERGGLHRRAYFTHEKQSQIPVITTIQTPGITEITLETDDVSLRKLLLFRTVCLKRIACKMEQEDIKATYSFFSKEDKKLFLKQMRWGTAFTFPAALVAIIGLVGEWCYSKDSIVAKLTVSLFLLGFIVVALEDFYYTVCAAKWHIKTDKEDVF